MPTATYSIACGMQFSLVLKQQVFVTTWESFGSESTDLTFKAFDTRTATSECNSKGVFWTIIDDKAASDCAPDSLRVTKHTCHIIT